MNSFGLGLILNFTDNATAKMNSASQAFERMNGLAGEISSNSIIAGNSIQALTTASYGLSIVGDQVLSIGNSLFSVFSGLSNTVIQTGTSILSARTTLNTLFTSAEEGEKAFQWAKDFSKSSIFNFEDLLPTMTMMKAVGIDVRDEISATSGAVQNLLEYASDLAAVFPDMSNMYGTGIQAAMGALKEYISEGNALSLQRGAGLDITGILDEEKGSTIEERSRQVADLIEKLGIMGMTANMAGTPMQRLSNIQDVWFNMLTEISDSGVFDKYSQMVEKISEYIFSIPDEELTVISTTIANAIMSMMEPIDYAIDLVIGLADSLRNLIKENPGLAEFVLKVAALSGILLVALGSVLKFSGSIFLLVSSISQFSAFFNSGISLVTLFGNAFSILTLKVIPFAALAFVVYKVWTENLFGLRDAVSNIFKDIGDLFSLTIDAFNDYTLSEDNFNRAKDLGILPFIESILQLKYHWGFFVDGFKNGIDTVFNQVELFFGKLEPAKNLVFDLANRVGEFFNLSTGEGMTDTWSRIGSTIGIVAGALTILIPVIKVAMGLFTLLSNPIGIAISLISILFVAWNNNFLGIQETTSQVIDYVVQLFNNLWTWISPVVEAIGNLFNSIFESVSNSGIMGTFSMIGVMLVPLFKNLWSIIKDLASVVMILFDAFKVYGTEVINMVSTYLVPVWSEASKRIADLFGVVVTVFSMIVSAIKPIISNIVGWISKMWNSWGKDFVGGIVKIFGQVRNILSTIGLIIFDYVLKPFISVVTTIIAFVLPILSAAGKTLVDGFMNMVDAVGGFVTGIITAISGILDFIIGVFTGNWEMAWNGVKDIFTGIWDAIVSVFKGIVNGIITGLNSLINGINLVQVPDWVPGIGGMGINIPNIPYLNTGGEIKEEGVSYLHPNEVVLNSPTTAGLTSFLNDYQSAKNNVVYPESTGSQENEEEEITIEFPDDSSGTTPVLRDQNGNNNTSSPNNHYDYSVVFSPGSIVIQATKLSDAELEQAATKLMEIIERKQKLRSMAVRK